MADSSSKSEDSKSSIWKDPRFAHLVSDPRFKAPRQQRKVKVDKRFEPMFNDEKFRVNYVRDKYGRKVNKTSAEDMKKYYDLSDEASEDEESSDELGNSKLESEAGESLPAKVKTKLQNLEVDYARGEGQLLSDSSSDEETSEEEDEESDLKIGHVWGELDQDAPRTDESTRRIAACNMDWDRIRAVDIFVLCQSFLPLGGSIKKVAVYPSEFGKARMKEEEISGPPELVKNDVEEAGIEPTEEDADESEFQREKLREYQLNRLKYFYAVIECDSVATADKLYAECDGLEYESTANKLDFRFIPDDVAFDEDEPREVCTEMPDLARYKPRIFTTTALKQAKVELTWDETDLERQEINEKLAAGKLNEINDVDLQKYVAYSSESEEESNNEQDEPSSSEEGEGFFVKEPPKKATIDTYKALLNEIKEREEAKKQEEIEREYTWGIGAESKVAEKKKTAIEESLTPFEKILAKKKERKKARKAKFQQGKDDSEDEDDVPDGIDMNDPYFAEEFAGGDFKPTKTSKSTKSKRKGHQKDEDNTQQQAELALLLDDDDGAQKSHFSLKKIQENEEEGTKKKKKRHLKKKRSEIATDNKLQDDFTINVNDERFSAVFTAPEFSIDPTDPHFKRTKAMETLIQEKFKRKPLDDDGGATEAAKRPKRDPAMSLLVNNIKRKAGNKG